MPDPNVKEMLEVAQECGLKTLGEAYDNYQMHYTMFFLIEKFSEQNKKLTKELVDLGLTETVEGRSSLRELSIGDALEIIRVKQ